MVYTYDVNIFYIKVARCRMKVLNRFDSLKSTEKSDGMVIYIIFNNNQASQVNFIEGRFKGSLLESQLKKNIIYFNHRYFFLAIFV